MERGQVVAKPGTIKPHKKFKAEVYVLEQGKRAVVIPRSSTIHRPQFYFRTTDVTGTVKCRMESKWSCRAVSRN